MADFKLCIADPKTGKCYQKEAKDAEAAPFIGLNIGESIKGESFGMGGYEFLITGGSDYCGFPMRKGILGIRKKIHSYGGVGFRKLEKGMKKRKTVCGHKINEKIVQINLKVTKEGAKKLAEIFPESEKKAEEKARERAKKAPKKTKEEKKEEKPAEKPKEEPRKVEEPKEKPAEKPKEEKKEEKTKEEKKESPKEERKDNQ